MIIAKQCKRLIVSIRIFVLVAFLFLTIPFQFLQAAPLLSLPEPGTMVDLSASFKPVMVKGLTVHPENPLMFDFIVSGGDTGLKGMDLKDESQKLIKYFLACLTVPENNWWVNLSPYENDKIVADDLGQTDLGRDMLAQDYLLKQVTASLIYPEKKVGKNFWDRVYQKAQAQFGSTQVPVNTFNKVWVLADKAEVLERNNTAFVVASHLKVMLDSDYLAMNKNNKADAVLPAQDVASQMMRQIVIPELEREVNTGKNFAQLRQIYNALILANWYKIRLKDALLNQVYANQGKVAGIDLTDKDIKEKIYQRYLAAYKKGAFNYIKEETVGVNQKPLPRKYFSGGALPGQAAADRLAVRQQATPGDEALIATEAGSMYRVPFLLGKSGQVDGAMTVSSKLPTDEIYSQQQIEQVRSQTQQLIDFIHRLSEIAPGKASTGKLVIYSGPPGGGKSLVWDGFKEVAKDLVDAKIIDKFILFHTRGIRPGEKQDGDYHFRDEAHLLELEKQGKIITTQVNGQLQGLALYSFSDTYKDPVTGTILTANISGLKEKLKQDKVTILEGGLGWFDKLNGLFERIKDNPVFTGVNADGLTSVFVSPFTEASIDELTQNARVEYPVIQAKIKEGMAISQQEFERSIRLAEQLKSELLELSARGGQVLIENADRISEQIFVMDSHQSFLTALGNAKVDSGVETAQVDAKQVVRDRARLETIIRIHSRQVKEAQKVKDQVVALMRSGNAAELIKMLNDKDLIKKVLYKPAFSELENRAKEAAIQVERRFDYGERLYNVWVNDGQTLGRLQTTLGLKFANYAFLTLLTKTIESERNGSELIRYYRDDVMGLYADIKQWLMEYKEKLGESLTLPDLLKKELFELVDSTGKPTGKVKPRDLVHRDGDWHRDSRMIFITPDNQVVLQQRPLDKDIEPGRLAESVGGHLGIGEKYEQALVREAKEEMGIDIVPERLVNVGVFEDRVSGGATRNNAFYGMYVYRLTADEVKKLVPQEGEVSGFKIVPIEQLSVDSVANANNYTASLVNFFKDRDISISSLDLSKIKYDLDRYFSLPDGSLLDPTVLDKHLTLARKLADLPETQMNELLGVYANKIPAVSDPNVRNSIEDLRMLINSIKDQGVKLNQEGRVPPRASEAVSVVNPGAVPPTAVEFAARDAGGDNAMLNPGGIDFNPKNLGMTVTKEGDGVKITINPAEVERMKREGVRGFTPIIINIVPIANVMPLLGLEAPSRRDVEQLAGV